ncbi:transcriptional regulator with XRE-family HTH domain [Thermocatellispora tengchongensis]|uniref:Transcriptional regulator with XRE-family HTH domain n=1 Tax=Thermocatellispora tengchongensis TaxID=1073253 RepID=A0A840PDS3_9ACTN|nr:helix-turn-helix transcriptional regulator [Thermocatellispora tengchongensis]MBB5137139.1 transcriptional regulator with XRE-family HTH domain [Thermocatellispora tengchongensis]
MDHADAEARGPLAAFLAARRATISTTEAGLPAIGYPRRVPGLRREEVAQLAGISVDYYTRLEQGRVRTASRAVLNSIGRALRLNEDEQRHLLQLAHPDGPDHCDEDDQTVCPLILRLLDNLVDTPALVMGRYLDILAWNRLGSALMGDLEAIEPRQRNYVRMIFLHPHTRALMVDWREQAQVAVSTLRMATCAWHDQPRLHELVGELSVRDDDFRTWWAEHVVTVRTFGRSRLSHPAAGTFTLDWQILATIDSEQVVAVASAAPGGPDHAAVRRLDAWAAARDLTSGPNPG